MSRTHGGDQSHPAPDFPFTQHRQRVSHRMNLGLEPEDRGIQIAEQAVADRGLRFHQPLYFDHVYFWTRYFLQHSQIMQPVRRKVARIHHFRPAEKVSLEIDEALLSSA